MNLDSKKDKQYDFDFGRENIIKFKFGDCGESKKNFQCLCPLASGDDKKIECTEVGLGVYM